MKYHVAAIDDHDVTLAGVRAVLGQSDSCQVVGTFHTVAEVLEYHRSQHPPRIDVVLLDLRLSDDSDPYDNATALREAGLKVLAFSSLESPYLIRRALSAGISGVVQKSASTAELIQAIDTACAGRVYASADWAGAIDGDPLINAVDLSDRQREVLELYAQGESGKRVARITGLSPDTVQDYLGRIRMKYALVGRPAHTKVELYQRAQEDGFLPGPGE